MVPVTNALMEQRDRLTFQQGWQATTRKKMAQSFRGEKRVDLFLQLPTVTIFQL